MRLQRLAVVLLILVGGAGRAVPQEHNVKTSAPDESSLNDAVRQLQLQVQQLQAVVQELKGESGRYREETLQLRHELDLTRNRIDSIAGSGKLPSDALPVIAAPPFHASNAGGGQEQMAKLEDDVQMLSGKVDEQYQTKVESASKYRVRLSGMLLLNLFSNTGYTDHSEVPSAALPVTPSLTGGNTGGNFGATVRQSQLGLEVYGPTLAGAKTRGDFVVDFFGEFPETVNGSSSGSLHVRTGTARMDWSRTSLVAGMDTLFISPSYPTSFASLALPAFAYSGNLWGWTPQLRVEHHLISSDDSTLTVSGGLLDPLTGETPPNEFLRVPGAGESSRQPAYGTRVEWGRRVAGQMLTLGVGGYYSRENWGFNRNIDGWAATTDWNVPFGKQFSLSGKFYRGRAIGGLGAGIGRSAVFSGPLTNPATIVRGIQATGGWTQFKFKPAAKWEFNAAAGQDDDNAGALRGFNATTGYFTPDLTRNRSEFANFIYRPRSNLLFSTEFRTLRTFSVDGTSQRANQLNLMMGVLF